MARGRRTPLPAEPDDPISARVREVVTAFRSERGPLLPALHAVQEEFGCVDEVAVQVIADVFNLSRAEVHGVVTFYRDFSSSPRGRSVVRICRAEACQSMGSESLVAHATERLGVGIGETASDRSVTLEQVFCLGNCALSPAVMVDGEVVGRVSPERFDSLISGLAPASAPPVTGSAR
jgi:formate dehydrogenase subunit gamma